MSTLILVNPNARKGEVKERWTEFEAEIIQALRPRFPGAVKVEFTRADDFGAGIVRDFFRAGGARVVVVGGDGTVSEAVQGFFDEKGELFRKDALLMVVPGGSGDDFLKSVIRKRYFSVQEAWDAGIHLIKKGIEQAIDVGRVDYFGGHRYFINVVSFGMPGMVVQKVAERKSSKKIASKGAWAYVLQSVVSMVEYAPTEVIVEADGREVFKGSLFSGFILNGHYNAGGVNWNEDSSLNDGFFDLLLSRPKNLLQSLQDAPRYLSGHWKGSPDSKVLQAKEVKVSFGKKAKMPPHPFFEIDGDQPVEVVAVEKKGLTFILLPGRIQILGPVA